MFNAALTTNPYITGIGFADRAPFEGNRISRYQKVSGEMELLWKTIVIGRPFDDGEKIVQDIFRLHSERMGRRVRVTSGMRHVLLRLYGLFHQYRKTTEAVVIPTTKFGRAENERKASIGILRALEEMGAIRQADGHWVRPGAPKAAKAASYTVNPLFAGVLEKVHESIVRVGYAGAFMIGLPSKDENNYSYITTDYPHNRQFSAGVGCTTSKSTKKSMSEACYITTDYPHNRQFSAPQILEPKTDTYILGGLPNVTPNSDSSLRLPESGGPGTRNPHNSHFSAPQILEPKTDTYSMSTSRRMRDAYQRRDKIRRLWMAPDENIAKLIEDKARLSCHHVGLGPEASDFAIIEEIRKKYHFSEIEKSLEVADSALPAEYRTRLNINIERDKHGNVHKIGCRPYNALCGTTNERKPDRPYRAEVLPELGLGACHIDRKCSVYNTAYSLRHGKSTHKDFYSAIAAELGSDRKAVKLAMMKANFGAFAESAAKSPFCRRAQCKLGGTEIPYGAFHRAMRSLGIDPMGTDTSIFLHEGAIYAIARRIFLERHGVRSICVFDSFYFDREVRYGLFGAVLKEALAEYLQIIAQ